MTHYLNDMLCIYYEKQEQNSWYAKTLKMIQNS